MIIPKNANTCAFLLTTAPVTAENRSTMRDLHGRFRFASAPVSWGVGDFYDPAWDQPYERILDEMVAGGYTGTELGPYGYFPTDAGVLRAALSARSLKMLSSVVPVNLADANASAEVIEQIRKVGELLAALDAPCIVMADAQCKARENMAGRV